MDLGSKQFIFVGGLHRSGTSILHEILRAHPAISGFEATGVSEDEGQFLQTVFPQANTYGGPGRFAFDPDSHMDESHPLATAEAAQTLYDQWSQYWDLSSPNLIEKSPPNIVRTRFLQALFPSSKFIVILRHPIAVAYATQKWSNTSVRSLVEHTLVAYERFLSDVPHLHAVRVLQYEEFVHNPEGALRKLYHFLGVPHVEGRHEVRSGVNDKYLRMWTKDRLRPWRRNWFRVSPELEARSRTFGYSLTDPHTRMPISSLPS